MGQRECCLRFEGILKDVRIRGGFVGLGFVRDVCETDVSG